MPLQRSSSTRVPGTAPYSGGLSDGLISRVCRNLRIAPESLIIQRRDGVVSFSMDRSSWRPSATTTSRNEADCPRRTPVFARPVVRPSSSSASTRMVQQQQSASTSSDTAMDRRISVLTKLPIGQQIQMLFRSSTSSSSRSVQMLSTDVKVSLLCPLTLKRMKYPARLWSCEHISCFDAKALLEFNDENMKRTGKYSYSCPICKKSGYAESSIQLNELLDTILKDPKTQHAISVTIRPDGTWTVEAGQGNSSNNNNIRTSAAPARLVERSRLKVVDVEANTTIGGTGDFDSSVEVLN